jgi:hypothetical protein
VQGGAGGGRPRPPLERLLPAAGGGRTRGSDPQLGGTELHSCGERARLRARLVDLRLERPDLGGTGRAGGGEHAHDQRHGGAGTREPS